jgi:hypothetical protein
VGEKKVSALIEDVVGIIWKSPARPDRSVEPEQMLLLRRFISLN